MSRSDISSNAIDILTEKSRSNGYWTFEVITTGATTYRWAKRTLASAWDGNAYSYKIISQSPIVQRRGQSEGGIQAASDFTFIIENKGNTITASDLKGASVKASYVLTATVSGISTTDVICSFMFRVLRAIPKEQTIELVCQDWLQSYLKGYYPNGNLMNDAFPSDNSRHEDLCEPLVVGDDAYIPLPVIVSSGTIYYILGKAFEDTALDTEQGTLYASIAATAALFWDTGQDFTSYAGAAGVSKAYVLVITDGSGNTAWGYIGEEGTGETLGSEEVINGDFSAWTDDNPDDWAVTGEDSSSYVTETSSGGCQIVSDGTLIMISQTNVVTVGKLYKYSIDIKEVVSGGITILSGGTNPTTYATYTTAGVKTGYFMAPHNQILIKQQGGVGACDVTIDDFSVKEVTSIGGSVISNGNFTDWTDDNPDNWTVTGEDSSNYVTENPSGQCQIVSDGSVIMISQSNVVTVGKLYRYSIDIKTVTDGGITIMSGGASPTVYATYTTAGIKTGYFTAPQHQILLKQQSGVGACDVTIDNFFINEVLDPDANESVLIYSTKDGSTQSWADQDSGFDANDIASYEVRESVDYAISEFSNPKEWGKKDTYSDDSSGAGIGFDQSDLEGSDGVVYRVVQPLCVDNDNDGIYENTFFRSGKDLLPFPCAFTRSDTSSKTSPDDVIDHVLQGFGIASTKIDAVSKAAAATTYSGWNLAFRLGLWFRVPRKKLLARLCTECHTDLVPVGHALGAEEITNGGFTNWTGDDPDNWTVSGEDSSNYITENPAGQCQLVSDGTLIQMWQSSILVVGTFYKYSIDVTVASGGIRIQAVTPSSTVYATITTTGTHIGYFTATETGITIIRQGGVGACDVTIDNFSVKEVTSGAIAFKSLTVTSQLSITKDMVLPGGFGKPRSLTHEEQKNCVYVAWQESGKPTDSLFKSRVPAKSSTTNPSGETLDLPDIPDSQNVQKAGKLAAQLLLLPEHEVVLHCKDEVLQVEPGDWVTIPHSDYGGSFVALVVTMEIEEYGSVRITVIKFSDTLDDWGDLSPSAITVEADTVSGGYNLVRSIEATDTSDPTGDNVVTIGDKLDIFIKDRTYGNQGAQIQYNNGTPRIYIGDGANQYFKYDGTNISWKGTNTELTAAGALNVSNISCTGGAIAGWTIDSAKISKANAYLHSDGYVSFGATPPSSYGNNVGAWLGYSSAAKMSLYADADNYLQWDGSKLLVKAANFTLDASGNITASGATISGAITATSGAIAGWTVDSDEIKKISANAGISLNSATPKLTVTDANGYERVFLGKSGATYGISIRDESNNVVAQIDDSTKVFAGWTIDNEKIYNANFWMKATGYISFGATPPTSYGNNVGAWLGYDGAAKISLYNDANNYLQFDGSTLTIRGSLNADDISAGTLTARTVQTASSGMRIVMSADDNEFHSYGDRGDETVEELATIGITSLGDDYVIGNFGSIASGHSNIALWAGSNSSYAGMFTSVSAAACYFLSTSSNGVYALSTNAAAVYGKSTNSHGIYGESQAGSGSYAAVYGLGNDAIGVYGISTSYSGVYGLSTNSYGVTGVSTNSYGGLFQPKLQVYKSSGNTLDLLPNTGATKMYTYQASMDDEDYFDLPDATTGILQISLGAAAGGQMGTFQIRPDGGVTKISGSTYTSDSNDDGYLCVYDGGGTTARVHNRLGATRTCVCIYFYS